MASLFIPTSSQATLFFLIIFTCLQQHFSTVSSFEYEVGNTNGWVVPASNDSALYNRWASKNRFKIGDTIHFKYQRDSVMLVTREEYKQCNSTHPIFFANNGNTDFRFDRSGSYYFISGVAGHCEKGQKMIIRVLVEEDTSQNSYSSSTTKFRVSTSLSVLLFIGYFIF